VQQNVAPQVAQIAGNAPPAAVNVAQNVNVPPPPLAGPAAAVGAAGVNPLGPAGPGIVPGALGAAPGAPGAPGAPPPFDHVGHAFRTNAIPAADGTNPVALAIDKEINDRHSIYLADNFAKAQDYKYALSGYDNLVHVTPYDMNSGPRDFDTWKDAWRTQVYKVARGHHPSSIKEKCLVELRDSLSISTWHWTQSLPADQRSDPDAILKALQHHAHTNANAASMLLKASSTRAGFDDNHI